MKVDNKTCESILNGVLNYHDLREHSIELLLKDFAQDHQTFREVLQAILDNGSTYHDVGSIHKALRKLLEVE